MDIIFKVDRKWKIPFTIENTIPITESTLKTPLVVTTSAIIQSGANGSSPSNTISRTTSLKITGTTNEITSSMIVRYDKQFNIGYVETRLSKKTNNLSTYSILVPLQSDYCC